MLHKNDHLVELFDGIADRYDRATVRSKYFSPAWIAGHVDDVIGTERCRVLDLGCGTGANITALNALRPNLHADGIDISPKMLEQARATNMYDSLNVRDLNGGLAEIAAESFDLVIAFGFLEFLSDVRECLRECHRVLRKNGVLWASFRRFEAEDEGSPPRHVCVGKTRLTGYSAGEILQMVDQMDMSIIGFEAVIGYMTAAGFPCPFYVMSSRKGRKPALNGSGTNQE